MPFWNILAFGASELLQAKCGEKSFDKFERECSKRLMCDHSKLTRMLAKLIEIVQYIFE